MADVEHVFSEQLFTPDVMCEDGAEGGAASNRELSPRGSSMEPARSNLKSDAKEKRKKKKAILYVLETKYDVVVNLCSSYEGWKASASADFDLLWCDTVISAERFMKLKPYQKMNHFVGMSSITRKGNLGRNLLRMRKHFPREFKFFPDTWILPTDLTDFKVQFNNAKSKTFIIKPDNGCQGKGIYLIRDIEKVPVDFSTTCVAQRYVHRPFLLDGHKFDLRLYVLVLGCDPLRIFLHRRGLVRLASERYEEPTRKNLEASTMHLTNYSINKDNPGFVENTNPNDARDGHKRSWEAVHEYLRSAGYNVDALLASIEDLIIKTLISVQPSLSHFYRSCQADDVDNHMCFEILGFDVIVDQKLQPWLLEVNHAPSFATESELDQVVKTEVLQDTFTLLNLTPEARRRKKRQARERVEQRSNNSGRKLSIEERMNLEQDVALERTAWEDQHLKGFRRLYPSEERELEYAPVHDAATSIWETLMGGNSRRYVKVFAERRPRPVEGDKDTNAKGNSGLASADRACERTESMEAPKRSSEEMRAIINRLNAGAPTRPSPNCRASRRSKYLEDRRDGFNQDKAPDTAIGEEALASTLPDDDTGSADRVAGPLTTFAPVRPDARGHYVTNSLRANIQVGDVVRVETTLGWERVTVKARRNNGKVDIQFKDGEYMRSVLPRILREMSPTPNPTNVSGINAQFWRRRP